MKLARYKNRVLQECDTLVFLLEDFMKIRVYNKADFDEIKTDYVECEQRIHSCYVQFKDTVDFLMKKHRDIFRKAHDPEIEKIMEMKLGKDFLKMIDSYGGEESD